ncbi:lactose transport system (lactose-binding protein) [Marinilactibacillus psychrotolerans 42ea]|uniref:Lactose transport system (Lactose-binding protein) n=1 Tax=Marinilactibacillus psychrotolerans 42ea TaxID=1255609 RepID=A0A1R4KG69_9LACT|nr:ABC transporter substrate-binding protein [Marinilactibacillus psychrotolerans]SJN43084.1 lactose transport system (lactose-binding protein) [Marinilactibacillus psychrotolerans 42ea]
MKNVKPWLALAASVLLVGCSSGESEGSENSNEGSTSDTGEITAWTWDPAFNIKALEIANEHYIESNPNFNLNIIENAQNDIIQKLNTSLSSGTTKGMPNIVLIEDYRAQSFLEAYPESFYPVTDLLNTDDFADYKVSAGTVGEEVYSVPFDSGVTGLYVRTDILEEAGYTVDDFTDITWDQYIEMGKKVEEETGTKMLTNDHNDLGIIRTMIQSSSTWYTEEDGSTPFIAGNEPLKVAFENYKEMFDGGMMNVHNDWSQFLEQFNGGNIATVPTGNWITPSIKAAVDQSGNWKIVPYPRQDIDSSVNASNLGGSSWYVLNIDGKEDAAQFLVDTFGSDVDLYQDLVSEIGAIGTYEPATSGESYQVEDEFFGNQKVYADLSEWVGEIPEVNFGQNTYAIEDILVVAMQEYLNGGDLDQILDNAQAQAESQIQ